jgi:hypothetical protein
MIEQVSCIPDTAWTEVRRYIPTLNLLILLSLLWWATRLARAFKHAFIDRPAAGMLLFKYRNESDAEYRQRLAEVARQTFE